MGLKRPILIILPFPAFFRLFSRHFCENTLYKSSLVKYFTLPDPKSGRFNCIFRCKGKDCDKLFKLDNGNTGGAKLLSQGYYCDDCGLEFCMENACEEEYHAPSFCSAITRWNDEKARFGKTSKEELQNKEYFLKNTKHCPKCKVKIEKIDGCNKITCKECKHSFCWLCLKPCVNYSAFEKFGPA